VFKTTCGTISDRAILFRQVIHPVAFRKKAFAADKCFLLEERPDGTVEGSLAWDRYLPTETSVRHHGCRLAQSQYQRLVARRGLAKLKPKDRRIYCGAYALVAQDIRAITQLLPVEVAAVSVVHQPEDDQIAHVGLHITLNPNPLDREDTKTAVLACLLRACAGPLRHICENDKDVNPHPSAQLSGGHRGDFIDERPKTQKAWAILIFCFCKALGNLCRLLGQRSDLQSS